MPVCATFYSHELAIPANSFHLLQGRATTCQFAAYTLIERRRDLDSRICTSFPHPNLSDRVNHNIVQSEIEGGVYLGDLPRESTLEVETQNRSYTIVHCGKGEALISGHPEFCPEPVRVKIEGSNWGGSMLKPSFVGRGMHLEFRHPGYDRPIITSKILEIRQRARAS